ncbi:diguanylate cyclase [Psychromonas arctica]|uniref:GGDEF domain-containing response regulator n=1 Tax=Psychromonas arctica TaxID=168275 RepID=UPI002FD086AB
MFNKQTVLIVDDSPSILKMLASCIKGLCQMKTAHSGRECLEIAAQIPQPDLILLDVSMPEMDGYEVCEQLKMNPVTAAIPVIFVTGLQGEKDEEKGLMIGAVDYITKPFRPAIVAARVSTHLTIKLQQDKLNQLAFYDQLTGLYNRHYLMDVAKQKMQASQQQQHPLWVLMIDVDHFKSINDNHGHSVGDLVLQQVGEALAIDDETAVTARSGGEEFVILFDQCEDEEAFNKAILLLDAVESLNPHKINVTISIGMAKISEQDKDFDSLLKRADIALYKAKENGRNRLELAF